MNFKYHPLHLCTHAISDTKTMHFSRYSIPPRKTIWEGLGDQQIILPSLSEYPFHNLQSTESTNTPGSTTRQSLVLQKFLTSQTKVSNFSDNKSGI